MSSDIMIVMILAYLNDAFYVNDKSSQWNLNLFNVSIAELN